MPIKVIDLKRGKEKVSLRGKTLELLKRNSDMAYTLKELYNLFLEEDKKTDNLYKNKTNVLYKLIYNYLREFILHGVVIHKGNYYYYKKEGK